MLSAVIPGYNSEETVGALVEELYRSKHIDDVIVVDNNSVDQTAECARNAGATVLPCETQGQGAALKVGFAAARHDQILKVDADIQNYSKDWVDLFAPFSGEYGVAKGWWDSDVDPLPITNLVVRPLIRKFLPDLSWIRMPVAATYFINRESVIIDSLPDGWPFDLEVLLQAHERGWKVGQVEMPIVYDDLKPISNYTTMAFDLLSYMVNKYTGSPTTKGSLHIGRDVQSLLLSQGGLILKTIVSGGSVMLLVESCGAIIDADKLGLTKKLHVNASSLSIAHAQDLNGSIDTLLADNTYDFLAVDEVLISKSKQLFDMLEKHSNQESLMQTMRVLVSQAPESNNVESCGREILFDIGEMAQFKYSLAESVGCSPSQIETMRAMESAATAKTGSRWIESYWQLSPKCEKVELLFAR